MTEWFVSRLPELPSGQEEKGGRWWKEVQAEIDSLPAWLARVRPEDRVRVERAGSQYALRFGSLGTDLVNDAWTLFCEKMLADNLEDQERSNTLWTLGLAYRHAGSLDRALKAAEDKMALDRKRGEEREAALAAGMIADIFTARGQLDDALKIMQEEELPVYEKLGDIHSRALTLRACE